MHTHTFSSNSIMSAIGQKYIDAVKANGGQKLNEQQLIDLLGPDEDDSKQDPTAVQDRYRIHADGQVETLSGEPLIRVHDTSEPYMLSSDVSNLLSNSSGVSRFSLDPETRMLKISMDANQSVQMEQIQERLNQLGFPASRVQWTC